MRDRVLIENENARLSAQVRRQRIKIARLEAENRVYRERDRAVRFARQMFKKVKR